MIVTNKSKNKAAIYSAMKKYSEFMTERKPRVGMCYHPSALGVYHNEGKCTALNDLRPRLSCSVDDGRMAGADYDEDVQTLSQLIEEKYTELRDLNDVANKSIVNEALSLYTSMMDERCYATAWWLLIVPIIVYYVKLPGHHKHCKEAAMARFDSKRERDDNVIYNHSSDYFRENLDELIEAAYIPYK